MKPQVESDFIPILRYSDKILGDDPGEKKCSVGDVRCFYILVLNFYDFWVVFFSGGNTLETGENTRDEIFVLF